MELTSLKESVQGAYGKTIEQSRDCKSLSVEIETVTQKTISTATLRRLFGLLKSSSTISIYNKAILNLYVDRKNITPSSYKSLEFLGTNDIQSECHRLIESHGGLNSHLLDSLVKSDMDTDRFYKYLVNLITLAVAENNKEFVLCLYANSHHFLENRLIFRTLGVLLKENPRFSKKTIPEMAKLVTARRQFFERFVDFGDYKIFRNSLIHFYKNETKLAPSIWAYSLICIGDYFSEKKVNWSQYWKLYKKNIPDFENLHPYLLARILGAGLLDTQKAIDFKIKILIEQQLDKELKIILKDPSEAPYFTVMILQYVIAIKDTKLLVKIVTNLKSYKFKVQNYFDSAIPFYIKLCRALTNNQELFTLDEIKQFYSGHTNEDVLVKYFATKFLNPTSAVVKYNESLIQQSGFVLLKKIDSFNPHMGLSIAN